MVAAWLRWFNGSREPAQAQPTCDEGSVRWRTNALNSVTPEQDDSASRPGRIFHDEELHVPDEEAPASGATVAPESQEEQGESVASGRDIIFARHLHETCDPPPISWRTFLQQARARPQTAIEPAAGRPHRALCMLQTGEVGPELTPRSWVPTPLPRSS